MMDIQKEIINKVAGSNLISFDLADLYPKGERVLYDIKEHLFQGLLLREKDFREMIKNEDWSKYQDQYVHLMQSFQLGRICYWLISSLRMLK